MVIYFFFWKKGRFVPCLWCLPGIRRSHNVSLYSAFFAIFHGKIYGLFLAQIYLRIFYFFIIKSAGVVFCSCFFFRHIYTFINQVPTSVWIRNDVIIQNFDSLVSVKVERSAEPHQVEKIFTTLFDKKNSSCYTFPPEH